MSRHVFFWTRLLLVGLLLALPVQPARAGVLKLSDPVTGQVNDFRISPNGQYVVYDAPLTGVGRQIYSVPITGGVPVKLNIAAEPPFQVGIYVISPDSQWVVYAIPPQSGLGFSAPTQLFRVPITGPASASVRLNQDLVSGGNVSGFIISPNGGRVVYRADAEVDNRYELYSVPLNGSTAPVKLNPSLVMGGNVLTIGKVTPDSSRVIYLADQDTDEVVELYSVPLMEPATNAIKLNTPLVSGGDVWVATLGAYFDISQNSQYVVYFADQDVDALYEIYSARVDVPASSVKLNVPLGQYGYIQPYAPINSASNTVVYVARTEGSGRTDVYSVPIIGPADAGLKLSHTDIVTSSVAGAGLFRNDTQVLIHSYPYPSGSPGFNAFAVPTSGPSTEGRLLFSARTFARSNQGDYIVYYTGNSAGSLFSYKWGDPPNSGTQLNAAGDVGEMGYRLSPDGTRVIYLCGGGGLCSVPISGPATESTLISGPMIPNGGVAYYAGFGFTPDSRRVIYRADAERDDFFELYVTEAGAILPPNRVFLPLITR